MKSDEAKLILRMHRADGRYSGTDPLFAEALEEAERDPTLKAWWIKEKALDSTVAEKLDAIAPPAGLRDAILIGARASKPLRRWWSHPAWLAAAAAVVVAVGVLTVRVGTDGTYLTAAALVEFSLQDLQKDDHDHVRVPPGAFTLYEQLSADSRAITSGIVPSFDDMKQRGCTRFSVAGNDVFEICFERGGKWFHVYAARIRPGDAGRPFARDPAIVEHGRLAAATWVAGDLVYTVATNEGADVLRAIL